jgi:hypothetical protein
MNNKPTIGLIPELGPYLIFVMLFAKRHYTGLSFI